MCDRCQTRLFAATAGLLACAAASAAGQYVKLLPDDGTGHDRFGAAVSLEAETLLIGAPWDTPFGTDSGSAYIFEDTGGSWSQLLKLTPSDATPGDWFGGQVDLSGGLAIIGAQQSAGDPGTGKAYIFERLRSGWTEMAILTASDGHVSDFFGHSVAINGDRAIIGSVLDDNALGVDTGSAYIFERIDGEWTQTAKLTAPDGVPLHAFGVAVAIQGDRAVVGAYHTASQGVYVFERSGGVWSQTAKLVPGSYGDFGCAVEIDGDRILVGAQANHTAARFAGAVHIFDMEGGQWVESAMLTAYDAEESDAFGKSVGLEADTLIVGSWSGTGQQSRCGAVYSYGRSPEGVWALVAKAVPADADSNDHFGETVALDAGLMCVGSPSDDDNGYSSGSVYVAPSPTPRSPDFNGDGVIDSRDVLDFLDAWSQQDGGADWDWNWRFDTRDVLAFLNSWTSG